MSIQHTHDSIIALGHGSYKGGAENFRLPEDIELHLVQPVGYLMEKGVAGRLIGGHLIETLQLNHDNGSGVSPWQPSTVYRAGEHAPNLMLHYLGEELEEWAQGLIGARTDVVTVSEDTTLSVLLSSHREIERRRAALQHGERLRVIWCACASQVRGNYVSL